MQKECIILNKPFNGEWIKEKENLAHEVIDFFLDDNGNHYVYNLKSGAVNKNINVGCLSSPENYLCKYMILTDKYDERTKETKILYIVELEKTIHNLSCPSKNIKKLHKNQEIIKDYIIKNDIKYCGKYLFDITDTYGDLSLSFKVKKIYKAVEPITFKFHSYVYQHNKGNVYSDINERDYKNLANFIDKNIGTQFKLYKCHKLIDRCNDFWKDSFGFNQDSIEYIKAFIDKACKREN